MNGKDLFGRCLYDYWFDNQPEDMLTKTNLTDEEVLPTTYLFRDFEAMPLPEQEALLLSKGKVLDVGAGSGTHSVWLQEKGLEVTALDFSEYGCKVLKDRNIKNVVHQNFFDFTSEEKFDTILFLMNGIGIAGKAIYTDRIFNKLDELLNKNGSAYIHSSDLKYLYEAGGGYLLPKEGYYGDVRFTINYKGEKEHFNWTYLDEQTLGFFAVENNYNIKKITQSDFGDFLVRVWKKV